MTMQEMQTLDIGLEWRSLAETLERVSALDPWLAARPVEAEALADGWMRVSDLLGTNPSLWLDPLLTQIMQKRSVKERQTAATFLIGSYSWHIVAAAITSYLMERRVPSLAPSDVAIRVSDEGEELEIQVGMLAPGFAALPNDPDAYAPGVTVYANLHELRDHLRHQIEGHLEQVIGLLSEHVRLGARGQWNLVADSCAAIFLWAGEKLGDKAHACAEGLSLIKAHGSPMRLSPTKYLTLTEGERCETVRMRGGCCLYYKTPEATNCSTCPLLPEEKRIERLRTWMRSAE